MAKDKGICYRNIDGIGRTTAGPYIPEAVAEGNAVWTLPDILVLVDVLSKEVPGDGGVYKGPAIKKAKAALNLRILRGGPKSEKGVKDKVRDLINHHRGEVKCKAQSGFTWSDEFGCNIQTPEEASVWDDFV
ncbi:hypothetical protein AURDEDRAFT_58737, partial [Auricularia subglabra TFB-10046 SS5]